MGKRFSQQVADLSVCAKNAEGAVAAAEKEAHGKIETHKQQARAAAAKATENVNQEIKSAGDTAIRNWTAVRAKVAADLDHWRAGVARAEHELDAGQAEHRAEETIFSSIRLVSDAAFGDDSNVFGTIPPISRIGRQVGGPPYIHASALKRQILSTSASHPWPDYVSLS
jgi:hypothetical protein